MVIFTATPELYFDTYIRHSISSFSSLANREEVNKELLMLELYIETGTINEVLKRHRNNLGDYIYRCRKTNTTVLKLPSFKTTQILFKHFRYKYLP
ncbi:hypothetical protein NBRC110019_13070 [Neptunitalea chrysea]|uniref:Uncharacterized protein n=1 Tax=Neptunitalea chrysea TaxID=1647581 RepID=A0A9W6EW14_9FLAO|nr:hypothetical protein [Neptunitalea chrysea]GLB52268.1 hypothetical protein NBRC110019_13070 [Neptunitalea chrysea]